ncbi:MAG: hypothetical protein KME05_02480 [Gloeocapsa sp. UFS-A4-WI-NPMV-4B04]|jgi:hypothetical protein|nr:hypothetical protein [Gloeocapsa sp. UFS-A4-WI-NPMV-4B04]
MQFDPCVGRGLTGTSAFFINGLRLRDSWNLDLLLAEIEKLDQRVPKRNTVQLVMENEL